MLLLFLLLVFLLLLILVQKAKKPPAPYEPLLASIGSDIYITRFRRHRYPEVWEMYKLMVASYWNWEEIDMETDIRHWRDELKEPEREFLKLVFAFFAFGDGMILENLSKNFANEVQDNDVRDVYAAIGFYESIHAVTYAMILDTLVNGEEELERLENMFKTDDSFIELKEWCEEYMDRKHSFASRILAFGCFEGIIFSGAFCGIYWFKPRGLMPGVTFSNELISKDEGMHSDFGCMLYNLLEHPLSYEEAMTVILESVKVAIVFITRIVPCNLLGINPALMTQYLKFITNRFFRCLKHHKGHLEPFPGVQNPFSWMEMISLQGKTNFFERRVGEYSNAAMVSAMNSSGGIKRSNGSVSEKEEWNDNVFTTDADF